MYRARGLQKLWLPGSRAQVPQLWHRAEVVACGIFSDQGPNMCLLHWQVDSLLLSCQGCPPGLLYAGLFYRYFPSGIL